MRSVALGASAALILVDIDPRAGQTKRNASETGKHRRLTEQIAKSTNSRYIER